MTANVFKLGSPEAYRDKEMTMRSKIAVQRILTQRKSIKKKKKKKKKKKASVKRHDSEALDNGGKKSKKRKKDKRVSGGDEIVNTETSKVNRSHEKALVNSDDDGAKRDKRRRVVCDEGNTTHKPKKKRSMLAKIVTKRGVQLTARERMAEDFKKLTGVILLSRNKDYLFFYRGKNVLLREVTEALVEQEKFVRSSQNEEEEARLREGSSALIVTSTEPSNEFVPASIIGETLDTTGKWGMNLDDGHHAEEVKHEVKKLRHTNLVRKLKANPYLAERKLLKAERSLAKVEECLQPAEQRADFESINGEERFMFRKRCLNMKALLLIGREGVFSGTVENMYLHWKYGELVKRFIKVTTFEGVKNVALALEAESGGIFVSIDKVSKGCAVIFYRGKEYKFSPMLRLKKKKALARLIKVQRRKGFTKRTLVMHTRAERLGAETELMEKIADFRRVKKLLTDVRFEPVSSGETLLSSREQMRDKELLLEEQFEEIEEQKVSVLSYMHILRDARTEVESERVKLRVAETKYFAHDLEVQLRELEKKEKNITEMSYNNEEEAEEEENKMIPRDHKANGCERSELYVLCQSCRCDNLYLRMVLATYKKECKERTHTFTVFRWQPGRAERYKIKEICQTYSKLKNICHVYQVDFENCLPDRDTAPNTTTTHEKEKHFSAIEEDINHKKTLLEKENDQLGKLCFEDLRGQKLKRMAESDGFSVEKNKFQVEREHTNEKKEELRIQTEYITREVSSIYPMKKRDNVQEEREGRRVKKSGVTCDKYFANGIESRRSGRTSELCTWIDSVLLKEKNIEATRQSVRLRTKRPSNIFEDKENTNMVESSRKGKRRLVKPCTSRNLNNLDSYTESVSNRHEYYDEQRRNSPVNDESVKDCILEQGETSACEHPRDSATKDWDADEIEESENWSHLAVFKFPKSVTAEIKPQDDESNFEKLYSREDEGEATNMVSAQVLLFVHPAMGKPFGFRSAKTRSVPSSCNEET
ncbi:hypothetical protein Bca4012_020231 [Brassica carinata]